MTRTTSHLIPALVSLLASTALADPPKHVGDEPPKRTSEATADPTDPTSASSTTATATAVEEPAERYPRSVIARPLTLPQNVAVLGGDATSNRNLGVMGGAPIVGYGITDKLEVQAPYSFATRELEVKGALDLDVGYAVLRGALDGKLEAIARVRGGYDLLAGSARPLALGLHVQYNVTPWLAVITGAPGTQQLRIALAKDADTMKPVTFGVPLGIGVQPTRDLYLQLDTKLVDVGLKDAGTKVFAADATPLALTAVYNVIHALDVQASIGADFNNAKDSLTFLVGARFYAGTL